MEKHLVSPMDDPLSLQVLPADDTFALAFSPPCHRATCSARWISDLKIFLQSRHGYLIRSAMITGDPVRTESRIAGAPAGATAT